MQILQRIVMAIVAATSAALVLTSPALAQTDTWPQKPVRIIVGYPTGGMADVWARIVAAPLSKALGQPVIVDSRNGANCNIAADYVAKSAPDGLTLGLCIPAIESINPSIYNKMPFNPDRDLVHVAMVG